MPGSRCVCQTIRDNKVFEKAEVSSKSSFPLVTFFDAKMGVGGLQIDDRKDFAASNTVEQVVNEREWIPILPGYSIQTSEVDTKPNFASLFSGEKYRGTSGRSRSSDVAAFKVGIDILSDSFTFRGGEAIDRTKRWSLSFFKLDVDVVRSMFRKLVKFRRVEDSVSPRPILLRNRFSVVIRWGRRLGRRRIGIDGVDENRGGVVIKLQ